MKKVNRILFLAGNYDLQPTALFRFKVESGRLWILSPDGKSWSPLSAESETRFFVRKEGTYWYEFFHDASGHVTGLKFAYLGIKFPPASKMMPE